MKKSMILLTAALSFGAIASAQTATPSAPQAPQLTDVPAGHWAKDAIDLLVSKGVLLGYPDGSFRGTQNLTRYEAAVILARAIDQMASGDVKVTISDEDVTVLQNAVQELSTELAALGVRVSDLEQSAVTQEDFARLEERVNALNESKGDNEAIADLQRQIDELSAADYAALRTDIDDAAEQVAALNDLTVLLNQDILALGDRADAIDAQLESFEGKMADGSARTSAVSDRVTKLETAPKFGISLGTVSVDYTNRSLNAGAASFDVDRLTQGTFAQGRHGDNDVKTAEAPKQDTTIDAGFLSLTARDLVSSSDGNFSVRNATVNLGLSLADFADANQVAPAVRLSGATVDGTFDGRPFGATYAWKAQAVKFGDAFYNNGKVPTSGVDGAANTVVATIGGQGMTPAITAVIGDDNRTGSVLGRHFGVKADLNLAQGSVAGAYLQNADRQGLMLSGVTNAFGLKASAMYAGSVVQGADLDTRAQIWDVRASTQLPALPVAAAGYFMGVTADYDAAAAFSNDLPKSVSGKLAVGGSQQYGGVVSTNLPFGLVASAYADREGAYGATTLGTSYGASAGVKVAGIGITGFYNTSDSTRNVTADGITDLGHVLDAESGAEGLAPYSTVSAPYARGNNYGVAVSHKAGDLISGLTFGAAYARLSDIDTSDLSAYAQYDAQVGGVTVQPFVRYRNYDEASSGYLGFTNIKGGVKASTAEGTLPLGARLELAAAGRAQNYSDGGQATTEQLLRAGVTFDNVVTRGLSFGLGYSAYAGAGLNSGTVGITNSAAFLPTVDNVYGGVSTLASSYRLTAAGIDRSNTVGQSGIYAQASYKGLKLDAARFTNVVNGGDEAVNTSFRVGYTFKF